jgi:hypothetical protein
VFIDRAIYERYFKLLECRYDDKDGCERIEMVIPQQLFPILNQCPCSASGNPTLAYPDPWLLGEAGDLFADDRYKDKLHLSKWVVTRESPLRKIFSHSSNIAAR